MGILLLFSLKPNIFLNGMLIKGQRKVTHHSAEKSSVGHLGILATSIFRSTLLKDWIVWILMASWGNKFHLHPLCLSFPARLQRALLMWIRGIGKWCPHWCAGSDGALKGCFCYSCYCFKNPSGRCVVSPLIWSSRLMGLKIGLAQWLLREP